MILAIMLVFGGGMLSAETTSAASSSMTVTGAVYPTQLKKGSPYSISGVIRSRCKLKSVHVGAKTKSGKWVAGVNAKASPNTKTYNIKKLDTSVHFARLRAGTYYYYIRAKDARGTVKTLLRHKLTVSSITASGVTKPSHLYKGTGFFVKGRVKSASRLTMVRAGIMTSSKKWIHGKNVIANPKAKSYNLARMDSGIPARKLSSGIYYYTVIARDSSGAEAKLVQKRFSVSYMKTSGCSYPTSLSTGHSFSLRGTVKSGLRMTTVKAGVKKKSGKWVSNVVAVAHPYKKSYSISAIDSKIKFGRLKSGTYYYSVKARDKGGYTKTLLYKKFTVGSSSGGSSGGSGNSSDGGSLRSGGRILSYNSSVIRNIGAQPYSGPCGIYAMAYCRAVLDGHFTKKRYRSIYRRIINEYGHGSSYAYWYEAGGYSRWYSTNRSCYKAALNQIAKGRPCIINLHNNGTGNNHYVAVIGYSAGTTYSNIKLGRFYALDPGYGKLLHLSNMNYSNSSSPQCITF